jgi:hypothetical protein
VKDRREETGTPRTEVVRAPHPAGDEPPDVIEVVFPSGPAPDPPRGAAGPEPDAHRHTAQGPWPSHRPRRGTDRRARPARPLLAGALALGAAGLTALVAWTVWPSYSASPDQYRLPPAPSYAPLPLPRTGTASPVQKRPSAPAGTPRPTGPPPPGPRSATPPAPAPSAAPPTTAAPSASAPPSPSGSGPRTLRAGDTGADVRRLQQLLFAQGFTYVSVTGVYDDATVRGVTQLQQDRGLACDPRGVYGPCTRASLTS